MQWLKSIAAYSAIGYLSLVGADALFFAYTGLRYTSRPGWEAAQQREQMDKARKKAFLKTHPEYSGLLSAAAPGVVTQLARKHAFLPLGHGLPSTPLIYCNEGYGFLKYTTDKFGFHRLGPGASLASDRGFIRAWRLRAHRGQYRQPLDESVGQPRHQPWVRRQWS